MRVGVIDYGVGNLGSVMRAVEELNATPVLLDTPTAVASVDCLILPGVGSFSACKIILDESGWTSALKSEVGDCKQPLLGICLGMQLLADVGMEGSTSSQGTDGLGFIPGRVVSLKSLGCAMRMPHMGWNSLYKAFPSDLFNGIPDTTNFYFVHSYAFVVEQESHVTSTVNYGLSVTASVQRENVWGVQFHPEKSSRAGFRVLRNFLEAAKC